MELIKRVRPPHRPPLRSASPLQQEEASRGPVQMSKDEVLHAFDGTGLVCQDLMRISCYRRFFEANHVNNISNINMERWLLSICCCQPPSSTTKADQCEPSQWWELATITAECNHHHRQHHFSTFLVTVIITIRIPHWSCSYVWESFHFTINAAIKPPRSWIQSRSLMGRCLPRFNRNSWFIGGSAWHKHSSSSWLVNPSIPVLSYGCFSK